MDPQTAYDWWLMALSVDNDSAIEHASNLVEWIGNGAVEPNWGGRRNRNMFIEWCRQNNINGAWDLEVWGVA